MNRRAKARLITTIICLLISIIALYGFVFVIDVSTGWRIMLILIAVFWIISGVLNIIEHFRNK